MSDSSEEKVLPPSDKKLRKAREKGQIPRSKEMVTAAVSVAGFGYVLLRAPSLASSFADGFSALPDSYGEPFPRAVSLAARRLGFDALAVVGPLAALVVLTAIVTNLGVNGGLVVSLDPITPKLERLNPVEGFKKLFALKTLLELVRSLAKLGVAGFLVFQLVERGLQALVEIPVCGLGCGAGALGALLKRLLLTMSGLFLVLGALDIGLQRWLFMRDQRMTLTEQKQERKDSDGNPEVKRHQRRERRPDTAKTGLRNATFAIRSATTVLALRYSETDAPVPVLVARATGEGAPYLVEELRSIDVPVVFDAAAVAVLMPRLKVGALIGKDMFQPVIACMHQAGLL